MSDPSISRRESLKRAAGALALGLGAPTAALAASSPAVAKGKIEFYAFNEGKCCYGRPLHSMEVPEEVQRMLQRPRAFGYIKIGDIEGESHTIFEVRRQR